MIEISSYDLMNAINNNETNFVFAIYNEKFENSKSFFNDLQRVANRAELNIYYIDYSHTTNDTSTLFTYDIVYNSSKGQYYGVYENGFITKYGYYDSYDSMYRDLFSYKYVNTIPITSSEEQEKYFEEAVKYYEEGQFNHALDKLNHAWPNEKAKVEYESKKYYQLVGAWENYEFIDKEYKKMNYRTMYFLSNNDSYMLYYEKKNQDYEGFTKPTFPNLSNRYYYIKDDIIYLSSKENGEYEPIYRIDSLDRLDLRLIDLKNKNKVYNFQRRD